MFFVKYVYGFVRIIIIYILDCGSFVIYFCFVGDIIMLGRGWFIIYYEDIVNLMLLIVKW